MPPEPSTTAHLAVAPADWFAVRRTFPHPGTFKEHVCVNVDR